MKSCFRPLFSWREICRAEACDPGQHVAAGVRVHQAVFQPLIDDQLTLLARIAQRIVHAPRVADIDIDVAVAVEQEDWLWNALCIAQRRSCLEMRPTAV